MPARGMHDNMKKAVETVFGGGEPRYNRRCDIVETGDGSRCFMNPCLVKPAALSVTPSSSPREPKIPAQQE